MGHVNWGILGAAKFAREHMAPAINASSRGRLAALATSSPEKAVPFEALAPGLTVHSSYDDLLDNPEIDAIYVPLPNHMHVPWAVKALERGKHVLVEKPLDLTIAGYQTVMDARDASGKLAAEAYMIVHHPQWHKAKELLEQGAIGSLRRVAAEFTYDNRSDPENIRNRPETGGGALPDIGVYVLGCIRYLSGLEPREILSTRITREAEVDVTSYVEAEFDGFHFNGMVSMRMAPWQNVILHGEQGVMQLSAPFNPGVYGEAQIILHAPDKTRTIHRFPSGNQYVHQVNAFNASVLDGTAYPCPLEFTRGTQQMIDDILRRA